MRRRHGLLLAFVLLSGCVLFPTCGGDDDAGNGGGTTPAPASKEDRTKAALLTLFEHVNAGRASEAAGHIVYRGTDADRKWKDVYAYEDEDDKRSVDRAIAEIRDLLSGGAPTFEEFMSETESEGEWLIWRVRFGEGDGAKTGLFACLDIDGTIAVGDID
ncbi:MAG: hypothetical protein ACYTG6_07530 [Planctomycetota bacterium]|jgi:hypothetical protein